MSTIERAVLKGNIAGLVEIRNIYTAEITEVGGDTSELLWDVYMTDHVTDVVLMLHNSTHFYAYDVYQYQAGQWVLIDEVTMNLTGANSADALLNAASIVLVGKAEGIRHLGRKFYGAIAEVNAVANGIASNIAAYAASALLSYVSPVTGIGGGTLVPGTVDKNGGFWPFVGGVVSSFLGTMRRRKPGNGI